MCGVITKIRNFRTIAAAILFPMINQNVLGLDIFVSDAFFVKVQYSNNHIFCFLEQHGVQVTIYKGFRWCGGFDVFHQEIFNIRISMINNAGKNALMSSDKLHRAL
jgi:hypothetical protein